MQPVENKIEMLTILITDDHPLFRKGLEEIIKTTSFSDAKILMAGNGAEAIDMVNESAVDLLFLDINMPVLSGMEAAQVILFSKPHLPVIVLTQFDEIPLILNFFKLGARGFLTKNIEVDEISDAMKAVLRGDYYYHSKYDDTISRWMESGLRKKIPAVQFTPREMQLIVGMSKGKTTREMSESMGLSFRSIETYRNQLLKKTNVNNTAELISYVYKNSIL